MDRNFTTIAAVAFLAIVVAIVLMPGGSEVDVVDVRADAQGSGPPLVQATLVNSGDAIDVRYWIDLPGLSQNNCAGTISLGANQRKAISFPCKALANYRGNFNLETGPIE